MMRRIQKLPANIVEKIAAGEIIERPASVVKELVENSLDAQATRIQIQLSGGGKEEITVLDNGMGITPEELELAVQSHATSKIRDINDLMSLYSLGFRGEALASIASISRMTLTSRPPEYSKGASISVEGGIPGRVAVTGTAEGTRVEVKDLFYNTPARLKFLKDKGREASLVVDQIIPLAIAFPQVQFRVQHGDRELLQTTGRASTTKAWGDMFGHDLVDSLIPLNPMSRDHVQLQGYLGTPELAQTTSRGIFLFVNNRPFYNRRMLGALLKSYQEFIPHKRFPRVLLFLDINPVHIDVNVHPTKREVSFSQLDSICHFIQQQVTETLQKNLGHYSPDPFSESEMEWPKTEPTLFEKNENYSQNTSAKRQITFSSAYSNIEDNTTFSGEELGFKTLVQVYDSYIIAEGNNALLILDQHAAHERILFNTFKEEHENKKGKRQPLLTPVPIELNKQAKDLKGEIMEELRTYNFVLEDFGDDHLLLREVPELFAMKDEALHLCKDLIQLICAKEGQNSMEDIQREIYLTMACHGSIRAGERLTTGDMIKLLKDLFRWENNTTCPHGRPIIKEIPKRQLEGFFSR